MLNAGFSEDYPKFSFWLLRVFPIVYRLLNLQEFLLLKMVRDLVFWSGDKISVERLFPQLSNLCTNQPINQFQSNLSIGFRQESMAIFILFFWFALSTIVIAWYSFFWCVISFMGCFFQNITVQRFVKGYS